MLLYIYYLFRFQKNNKKIKALINFASKINVMMLAYTLQLDLKVCHNNIKISKIDNSTLNIFAIVLASF